MRFLDARQLMTTWKQGDADVENVKQTYMSAVSSCFPLNRPEYSCIHSASVRAVYAVQDSPLVPATASGSGAIVGGI
jgi:hypothetical protein